MIPEKVLYINLSDKSYTVKARRDLFERYIGGSGVAIKLLAEECRRETDPLHPENPIVLAVGPLTGLFPFASKTVAMFKSPLTGNLGESHAGGRSAVALRMAGYGAAVIRGASETPVYLSIHQGGVHFRDASALWGVGSSYTVGRILRERETEPGLRTIMRIGAAGEKLVSFACVTTETYRHFGRLGLGAVFGSKKLKALVIAGSSTIEIKDQKKYREVYDRIYRLALDSKLMKKYHDLGTAANVVPLNALQALPTRNLTQPAFDNAEKISGEYLAQNFLGRRVACAHCPTACIHLAALREPYEDEPYFYKTTMISYDHELIYALGSMLGVGRAEHLLKLIDAVEKAGLDAMSTGVALAWATEMLERAKISEKETVVPLAWGDHGNYIRAVRSIVSQPNEFYRALASGVDYASTIYGGKEFALAFGKTEMAGYNTGPLFYATLLTGARHSHLDSAGYSFDEKRLKAGNLDPEEGAEMLLKEESWRCVLTSLAVCLFARGIYDEKLVEECLSIGGLEVTSGTLAEKGFEILKLKHEFKKAMGFDWKSMKVPERIFEVETPAGRIRKEFLSAIVERYFRKIETDG
ncbi:MAG: aldehyde:ferredoxin oxidoreductase [Thermoplasmata archaeon]|nr:aldehyde:ferredoxin oxidoreductase [Thermoplasmata archaeon]